MQTGFEGRILFSSTKSCIQKVCSISLTREHLRASLPLFWTWPITKNLYEIAQNSSFNVASIKHTNYNLLGRHVVDRPYNQRNLNGQGHSNIPSSTITVSTEFKEISLDTYTEKRVLRSNCRFINHGLIFTGEESVESSEAVSRTFSENSSVDFRINKTNWLVVFNYSSSTFHTNKFQAPTEMLLWVPEFFSVESTA